MNTLDDAPHEVLAIDVRIEAELFVVRLNDGREIGVPYSWFWRLEEATEEERRNWKLIGEGDGIHWEEIDEDISVKGILRGKPSNPARRPGRLTVPSR
jgi:hypothetical protein